MAGVHREAIQKQIHQDWANREYIEVITTSIKRITDFLNSFGECFVMMVSVAVQLSSVCFFSRIEYGKTKVCFTKSESMRTSTSHR